MAFKQNLRAPLLIAMFFVFAALVFIVITRPPHEDRQKRAIEEHARTLGPVKDIMHFGTLADVRLQDGKVIHIEATENGGTWTFKNLRQEFERTMKDPTTNAQVIQRLGERLSQRFKTDVKFREGMEYQYQLIRDNEGKLAGFCVIRFGYPSGKRGQYQEIFRWENGAWVSGGGGSLFDGTK